MALSIERRVGVVATVGRDVPGRGERIGLVVEWRRRVVGRGGVDALPHCFRQHEGLEGRARLTARLGGEVELVALGARDLGGHGQDLTRLRIDRDHSRGGVATVVERAPDRCLRRPLKTPVDGRVDLEATRAHGVGAVLRDELVVDVVEEVAVARGDAVDVVVAAAVDELDLRADGFAVLLRRQVAVREHGAQHLVASAQRLARLLVRVVVRRCLRQPCEQRGLRQRQQPRRAAEVRLGGCLDTVGVVAVVDRVQVLTQDPVLRVLAVELDRQAGFLRLALERALVRDRVQVADELLCDRRRALHRPARLDVPDRCAKDALPVDAAVLVETAILDRDRRLAHPGGDVAQVLDRLTVPLCRDRAELLAVAVVDERVGAERDRLQGLQVAVVEQGSGTAEARRDRACPGRRRG